MKHGNLPFRQVGQQDAQSAIATVSFIDEYCILYQDLFRDVTHSSF
ncbi:hypothetical protein [Fischerella sp. PCC 9605]|nr:hypothetical protein [Fischerella sp. PCC 9605]